MIAFEKPRWINDPYCNDIRVDEIFIDSTEWISGSYQTMGFFQLLQTSLTRSFNEKYPASAGNPIPLWEMADTDPQTGNAIYKGINAEQLDAMYIDRSGSKILRKRLVDQILYRFRHFSLAPGGHLFPIPAQMMYIVQPITRMYSKRWTDLWNTIFYEFDPIENYNMIEQLIDSEKTFTHGKTETLTNALSHHKTGNDTNSPATSETITDQTYGFNSSNPVNKDKRSISRSGSDQMTYNTTETDSGTSTNAASGSDRETHEYTLTRKGNIGVTTSQQMIEQQRQLLMFDYFNNIVFPDIDKIITMSVY